MLYVVSCLLLIVCRMSVVGCLFIVVVSCCLLFDVCCLLYVSLFVCVCCVSCR